MILNREAWLTKVAARYIAPLIALHQEKVKPLAAHRISVGWPKGSRGGKTAEAIGQCWPTHLSSDKHHEVFISPILGAFEAVEVLIHELVHVAAGLKCKHKGEFKRLGVALGLKGKMTATVASDELAKKIRAWIADMPEYPHGPMSHEGKKEKEAKPGSRLVKVFCDSCEYTLRASQKWLDVAVPLCPNEGCDKCGIEMEVESK